MNADTYDARRLVADLQAKLTQAKEHATAVATVVGDGEAADGMIKVTVGPSGALKTVELDPKAMRLPSVDLAAGILAAAQAAQGDVMTRVREIYGGSDLSGGLDIASVAQGEADISALIDAKLEKARAALQDAR